MNMKNIAERFNYGYESDNLNNSIHKRSKSYSKDSISNKNYDEHLEEKLNRNKNNRFLVPKSQTRLEDNEKSSRNIRKNKIESLGSLEESSEINNKIKTERKPGSKTYSDYSSKEERDKYPLSETSEESEDLLYENEIDQKYYTPNSNNFRDNFSNKDNYSKNKSTNSKFSKRTANVNPKYSKLKEKYTKLKEELYFEKEASDHWRKCYFNLLNQSLLFDETIKTLLEENRIHQEYIINLENKNDKMLSSASETLNRFHEIINNKINPNFFCNMTNNDESNNNSKEPNELLVKNFNEIINDYKKQLEIFFDEKENLFRNLSLTRHQNLQMTLKLEELQNRVYEIERLQADEYFIDKKE